MTTRTDEKLGRVIDGLAYTPEELAELASHGEPDPAEAPVNPQVLREPDGPEPPDIVDHGDHDDRPEPMRRSNLAMLLAAVYIVGGAYTVYIGVRVLRAELNRSR